MRDLKSNIWKNYLLIGTQGFWFVLPIFILYFQSFGLNFTQIGWLEAAFSFFFFLLTIPLGAFSDLVSRKLSILLGTIGTAFGMLVIGLGSTYSAFLAGNLLWAIGDGFLINARGALMYDSVKQIGREEEYLKISGRANIFSVFPLIISGFFGPIIYLYDRRLPWLLMAALWAISTVIIFFMVEPDKVQTERSFKNYIKKIWDGLKFTYKKKHILWIMVFSVAMAIPLSVFNEIISQVYYIEIGFSVNQLSIIFPIIYGVASLSASQSFRIEKLLGEKGSFIFIVICHSIGLILMGLLNTPFILVVIIITYISRDFRWVYLDTYVNKHTDSKIRATVLSIISMAISLVLSFIFVLGGILSDTLGIFQTILVFGLFTAICSVILLIIKPKNNSKESQIDH